MAFTLCSGLAVRSSAFRRGYQALRTKPTFPFDLGSNRKPFTVCAKCNTHYTGKTQVCPFCKADDEQVHYTVKDR